MVAVRRASTALCSRARAQVFPPPLEPGNVVAVVAPSSPCPRDELWRGSPGPRDRPTSLGYLAGGDAQRAAELSRAMVDPQVKAIVAARGGYGAMRILDALPWEAFARQPKWIVGFSDITALHATAWAAGVASVHGPNVSGLGRDASVATRAAWLASVERPAAARAWRGLRVVRGGEARGPIVGGNLALLHAMAAADRLLVPRGAVLALEDVTEAPYRVDRMLTSLLLGGHLARAAAVVLGGFERCAPGADGCTVDEVLEERTRALGVPVLAGAPFGHGARNEAFVLGARVRVSGNAVLFDEG
jgi:muramoyltetrapeptide carboxypeptidase